MVDKCNIFFSPIIFGAVKFENQPFLVLKMSLCEYRYQFKILARTEAFKKFKVICTHTGRRPFYTNAYCAGVVGQDIMTISGHSTKRAFMLYLKLGESQKAQKIG